MLLQIQNLNVHYQAIHALKGIHLEIKPGERVALIGANGAGKSTLLRAISGIIKPSSGQISYRSPTGDVLLLNEMPPEKIVASGVAQVPEGRQIFSNLSVKENLELGAYSRKGNIHFKQEFEQLFKLFPRLKERLSQNAGTLSGGEQQMLAIARALMAKPQLLLLDEPSLGISPALTQQIFATLRQINEQGVGILLVEQDAYLALENVHRAYVLETGEIKLQGNASDLLKNSEV
ncbi:MAG: ABC transporter ATP-binding protein, partial [Deltaproteobacteria bacterium]|nr:ABC transporter ATP-binding protein [Deltaproteobacteria bacterium]